MDYALSDKDIRNVFHGEVNVYTYDELEQFDTIDDMLYPYNRAVILYFWQSKPKYGHWCCVSKNKNIITFVDSFGSVPDNVLDEIPRSFKRANGEDYKYLSSLLYNCPYEIHYNNKKWQNDSSCMCGRYAILWLICSDMMPIEKFQKLFTKNTTKNDRLVYDLTKCFPQ